MPSRRGVQVAAHRHALGIADGAGVAVLGIGSLEVPAAEEPHRHARSRGGIGFLALHRVPDGLAGVLGGPDGGIARRADLPVHDLDVGLGIVDERRRQALRARLLRRRLAEEVVLFHGGKAGMGVGTADHAELVGVGAKLGFELQTVPQRRAGILELEHLRRLGALASRLPKSQLSKSANSSLGDSAGCVSPSPLVWVAS